MSSLFMNVMVYDDEVSWVAGCCVDCSKLEVYLVRGGLYQGWIMVDIICELVSALLYWKRIVVEHRPLESTL